MLQTDPDVICHGAGKDKDSAQEKASLTALEQLSKLGLKNVKPKELSEEQNNNDVVALEASHGEIEVPPEEHKPARKRSRPKNDEASKKKKEKTEIPFIRQKQIDVDLEGDFAIEIDGKIMQKCNKCDKMFPKLGSLRSHIKFVHLKIREWLCSMCPKMFVSKLRLEEHFRSHTGVRPYKCEFCPMAFATPTRKKLHMIIHTGENPNVCKYCGKRFASYATLQGHIFIHTKQGVECTVCKKMFARAVDVKKHMAVHTQEKSFICKICGKGYLYATSLKSHMKNHTFENVSCKICGDSVSSLDEWNYHQQLHAKEIFECETCGVTFIEQHELYAHMRTAHVDIENLQKAKSEREMDKVPPLAISKTEEQITIPEATVTTEENEISVNNELLQSVAETNLFNS
uniref:Protein krueppel n=1 Tax=Megaselia scalaris TaxID=36166 RepID=T1GSA1_MEGSC